MQAEVDFLKIGNDALLAQRGLSLHSYECIDSTNTEARRYAERGGGGNALFVANGQSGGRGRTGKTFYSPEGSGIYLTLLLDITDDAPASVVALTSAAAVALAAACHRVCGVDCGIKWVNDIYVGGKKVCGILAESFTAHGRRFAAIGVGINLCTDSFPEDISDIAGSLVEGRAQGVRRQLVLAVVEELTDIYAALRAGNFCYMDRYRALSLVLGKEIRFWQNGTENDGAVLSIEDSGALKVRLCDGSVVLLSSGEISLRLK